MGSSMTPDPHVDLRVQRALISVSDKTGLEILAPALKRHGIEILSTSGTLKFLTDLGIECRSIESFTGSPEVMKGRVKTLHPKVHGGILFRRGNPADLADLDRLESEPIDLVIVNLYPFRETLAKPGAQHDEIIEQIDIGGPTMVRSAAKSYLNVGVVVDPTDYQLLIDDLDQHTGAISLPTKQYLAGKAFAHTCAYDLDIARYMSDGAFEGLVGTKLEDMRYGENPFQERSAVYVSGTNNPLGVKHSLQVEGATPGYVNRRDIFRLVETATCINETFIMNETPGKHIALGAKHGNCCGACAADSPQEAIEGMINGNSLAIHGGSCYFNFPIGEAEALALRHYNATGGKRILDVVIAPAITPEAIAILKRPKGACKILINPAFADPRLDRSRRFSQLHDGFMTQSPADFFLNLLRLHPALETTGSALTPQQISDLLLATAICHTSNSNTITLVKHGMLLGNGTCRPSRVEAAEIAIRTARDNGHQLGGAVATSDSFFPFPDGPTVLADAGISAVFATRGSQNDAAVLACLAERGVTFLTLPDIIARGFYGH